MTKGNSTRKLKGNSTCPKCDKKGTSKKNDTYCKVHEKKCSVHPDLVHLKEDECSKCTKGAQ